MMFAFCMIRAAALAMRIAWAARPTSVRVAIAANILAQAGTVVVFIINLFLAQRIVRGYHPEFGWSTPARVLFRFFFFSVVACLIMVIVATVQSFYTLDVRIKEADRLVQLFSGTYLALLAFLPIPIVILAATLPRSYRVEKFGEGSWAAKLVLLLMTATLLSIGAFFRAGTNFEPRPLRNPAWYHSRATFYIFNFVLDAIVAYTYLASFFHKRFYVPPKAKGPGSYSGEKAKAQGAAASPYITSASRPGSNFSRSATSFKKPRVVGVSARRSDVTLNFADLSTDTDEGADPPPPFLGPRRPSARDLVLASYGPVFSSEDYIDVMTPTGGPSTVGPSSTVGAYTDQGSRDHEDSIFGGDTEIGTASVGSERVGALEDMLGKIGTASTPPDRAGHAIPWGQQQMMPSPTPEQLPERTQDGQVRVPIDQMSLPQPPPPAGMQASQESGRSRRPSGGAGATTPRRHHSGGRSGSERSTRSTDRRRPSNSSSTAPRRNSGSTHAVSARRTPSSGCRRDIIPTTSREAAAMPGGRTAVSHGGVRKYKAMPPPPSSGSSNSSRSSSRNNSFERRAGGERLEVKPCHHYHHHHHCCHHAEPTLTAHALGYSDDDNGDSPRHSLFLESVTTHLATIGTVHNLSRSQSRRTVASDAARSGSSHAVGPGRPSTSDRSMATARSRRSDSFSSTERERIGQAKSC